MATQDGNGAYTRVDVSLRYRLAHGALAPYFDALVHGHALAARCAGCGRAWFPPRLRCCAGAGFRWDRLDGHGRIECVTSGTRALPFDPRTAPGHLALVQLDGAANRALGWLDGFAAAPAAGTRVRLAAAPGATAHPAQAARFVPA